VRLLASNRDGEVLAAARALARILRSVGSDFHDLAALIESAEPAAGERPYSDPRESPYSSTRDTAEWLLAECEDRLSEKEKAFLRHMCRWRGEPTERQQAWFDAIVERVERGGSQ
jgi:methionine synthase II (cobalamin-independent)